MPEVYSATQPFKKLPGESNYSKEMKESREYWRGIVDGVLAGVEEYPRTKLWGSYCVRPRRRFITQQQDEEIVLLLRAHPITNIPWILLVVFMLFLPSLLLATGMFANVPFGFIFIGKLVWYLMTLMIAFEKFLDWYYSVFIITNERLVDIDFYNLLFRMVTYANLNHIEEPASVTGGFIRSLFQYGNVWVTTASEKPTVEALAIPYPDKVVDIISRLAEELEKRRERGQ